MKRPNFFIVGAPKCGTTAMNAYLGAHPEVFMCPRKEVHHFAPDLPGNRNLRFSSTEAYLSLFSKVGEERVIGEASVFYLLSKVAASEIRAFAPGARVLAMLRNPIDWVSSYHAQLLLNADEELGLDDALSAQEDRRLGKRLPQRVDAPTFLLYDEVCRFSTQIERYFQEFGRRQVMVLLLDDLKADASSAFQSVLDFLEVDRLFRPKLGVINANREAVSVSLGRLIAKPPRPLRAAVRAVLPWSVASRLRDSFARANQRTRKRPQLDSALRARLVERYQPEIQRLEELLGRDLSHWLTAEGQEA